MAWPHNPGGVPGPLRSCSAAAAGLWDPGLALACPRRGAWAGHSRREGEATDPGGHGHPAQSPRPARTAKTQPSERRLLPATLPRVPSGSPSSGPLPAPAPCSLWRGPRGGRGASAACVPSAPTSWPGPRRQGPAFQGGGRAGPPGLRRQRQQLHWLVAGSGGRAGLKRERQRGPQNLTEGHRPLWVVTGALTVLQVQGEELGPSNPECGLGGVRTWIHTPAA